VRAGSFRCSPPGMRARRRRSSDPDSETDAPVWLAAHGGSWRGMRMQVGFYKVDDGRLCAWMAAPPKPASAFRDHNETSRTTWPSSSSRRLSCNADSGDCLPTGDLQERRRTPPHAAGSAAHPCALSGAERHRTCRERSRGCVANRGFDSGWSCPGCNVCSLEAASGRGRTPCGLADPTATPSH